MFEKCCSRALGPANLRLCFLLPAPITFTSQWSNHLNCFPFTGKTNTETLVMFPTISPVLSIFAYAWDPCLVHKRQLLLILDAPLYAAEQ